MDRIFAEGSVSSPTLADTVDWDLVDNLGSLRDVLDNSGNVIDHDVYSAFGQVAYESNPSIEHFTGFAGGHVAPTTGLVNDANRWYDPATGKWISKDPDDFRAGDANLLRYVGNDPVSEIDPDGLQAVNPSRGGYNPNYHLLYIPPLIPPSVLMAADIAATRRQIVAQQVEYANAQAELTLLQNQQATFSIRAALAGAAERDRVTLAGWLQVNMSIDNALRDSALARSQMQNAYRRSQMAADAIRQLNEELAEQEAAVWEAIKERTEYLQNMPGNQQHGQPR